MITFSPNTKIKSADVNSNFTGLKNGSELQAMTNIPYLTNGAQKGQFGGDGGSEHSAVPVRNTSAGNKFCICDVNYPYPFNSQPTLVVTHVFNSIDNSNADLSGSTTVTTYHKTNSDGKYVGFTANYQNNANYTANTHIAIIFTWSATV